MLALCLDVGVPSWGLGVVHDVREGAVLLAVVARHGDHGLLLPVPPSGGAAPLWEGNEVGVHMLLDGLEGRLVIIKYRWVGVDLGWVEELLPPVEVHGHEEEAIQLLGDDGAEPAVHGGIPW